jgi:tRNA A-37 threonylcarbamoyl transferase component Bud32
MSAETSALVVSTIPFQPGGVLGGRYRLGALLGRGGMAEVYRACDEALQRPVAIKLFRRDSIGPDDETRQRAEVQMLAGLRHSGLVTVYDTGTEASCAADPRSYLVLELVDGQTLGQHVADGPVPGAEVAAIGRQLASALAYVHSQGIVHRDVKPANILLDRSGADDEPVVAKLTDFGVARYLDGTRVTTFGTTVGTANYLSPEQALGQEVTAACDVYSLGLVLLECLTGTRAYPGHGVEAAIARLHRDPTIPPTLGPAWSALLVAMTARDPSHRPSAADVAGTLRDLAPAQARVVIDGADEVTETIGPLPGFHWLAAPALRSSAPSVRMRGRRSPRRGVLARVGVGAALAVVALVVASAGLAASPSADPLPHPPAGPNRPGGPVDAGAGVPVTAAVRTAHPAAPPDATRRSRSHSTTAPRPATRSTAATSPVTVKLSTKAPGGHAAKGKHRGHGKN